MNCLEIFERVYGPTEWSESALTSLMAVADLVYAEAKRELIQPLTDPENQPSQFGTVTLEMYEALENSLMQSGLQIEAWQGRYYAKEDEIDQLKADLRALWNNRGEPDHATKRMLVRIHDALDGYLGDTDPYFPDDMTDEEIREENPVFWAAKEMAGLIGDDSWDQYTTPITPAAEPVAWMKTNGGNGNEKVFISAHIKQRGYDDFTVPLYTHPAAERRVPKVIDEESGRTDAMHAAVRKVLKFHKLTEHGNGVVEADLIEAMLAAAPKETK